MPRFDEFLREELPKMFDLTPRQSRNTIEDNLSKASLLCEPREMET